MTKFLGFIYHQYYLAYKLLNSLGGKPSGIEVTSRKKDLEMVLKHFFELREGSEVTVEFLLSWLGFEHDKKVFLSRHIKEIFPGVYTSRENKGGHKQYPLYYV